MKIQVMVFRVGMLYSDMIGVTIQKTTTWITNIIGRISIKILWLGAKRPPSSAAFLAQY